MTSFIQCYMDILEYHLPCFYRQNYMCILDEPLKVITCLQTFVMIYFYMYRRSRRTNLLFR